MNTIQKIVFSIVFILLIIYVLTFTPNIPIADQWSFVHIIKQPNLHNLWERVSEHRVFFPNIISVALAHLSRWNIKFETMASLLFFSALILLIFQSFAKKISDGNAKLFFFFALLTQYSPIHHENILFSFSAYLFCLFFVFLAISNSYYFGSNLRSLIIVLSSLVIASFSFITGLLGWIACLPGIFLAYKKKISNKIAYATVGALTFALYFSENILTNKNSSAAFSDIFNVIKYFFIYFGANFIPTYKVGHFLPILLLISGVWGFVFFVLGIILVIKTIRFKIEETFIPYSMILFSFLVAIITSIGRVNFGMEFALLSRYHIYQMFYFIGFIWLLVLYLLSIDRLNKYLKPAIILFMILILSNWTSGIALGIFKLKKFSPIEKELRLKG